jgi:prostaglandin-endoperoxide synthase 2
MKFGFGSWVEKAGTWLVKKVPALQPTGSKLLFLRYARAAAPRPHPLSLAVNGYTSWKTLTDRSFSGRHLPPCSESYAQSLPDELGLVDLFMRTPPDRFEPARDTSLLFPFFAQWFTDSFLRTDSRDYRKNQSNHGIDLCQIYGMSEIQTNALRARSDGRLKSRKLANGEEFAALLFGEDMTKPLDEFKDLYTPENFKRVLIDKMNDEQRKLAMAVGLEHGNSTIGNSLMNTIFLREHNRLTGVLNEANPNWDDDRLFETARNINIVLILKIVVEDYIRHIASTDFPLKVIPGFGEKEKWHRPNHMAVEFNILYRWHGLIPNEFRLGNKLHDSQEMLNANHLLFDIGVDEIVRSASKQKAGRIGLRQTPAFLKQVKHSTLKLAREAKLQPYNAYRKHFKLAPCLSFEELTDDRSLAAELKQLYKSVDDVEYLVGLLAEQQGENDMMGELQLTMVAHDAFTHALTNPLLSSTVFGEKTFSAAGLKEIEATSSIADLIERNTSQLSRREISFKYEAPQ